jgi:hypothetical protein
MTPSTGPLPIIAILASAVLIAWRVRARIRRLVGRQRLSPLRSWVSVAIFTALVIALLIGSLDHPLRTVKELTGVAIGIGLAVYGLRVTRFESTPSGLYYTPSAHIGVALSLLVVARVAYRLFQSYAATAGFTEPPASLVRSPLTLLLVGTLAGYYAWYALGLLRWRRSLDSRRRE